MQSYVAKVDIETKRPQRAGSSSPLLKEIGIVLREAREKKSYSIRDIKEITCIPVHHITAIESGEREKLPEDLYLISFIKHFARAVDIDERVITGMIFRERRYKSQKYELEAFDLLFGEEKNEKQVKYPEQEQKVVKFKNRKNHLNTEVEEKKFFKVYHFYLLIGMTLFVTALYMIFQTIRTSPDELKIPSTLVVEEGKPVFVASAEKKLSIKENINEVESDEVIVDEINENPQEADMEENAVAPDGEVSWGEVDLLNKKQAEIQTPPAIAQTIPKVLPVKPKVKVSIPVKQVRNTPVQVGRQSVQKQQVKKIVISKPQPLKRSIQNIKKSPNINVKSVIKNELATKLRPLNQTQVTHPQVQGSSNDIKLRPLIVN